MKSFIAWGLFVPAVIEILRISHIDGSTPGGFWRSMDIGLASVWLWLWWKWKDKHE